MLAFVAGLAVHFMCCAVGIEIAAGLLGVYLTFPQLVGVWVLLLVLKFNFATSSGGGKPDRR